MPKKQSLTIFFPFLNDWGTVGSLIGLAAATAAKLTDDFEILIINDGSRKADREALGMIINETMKQGNNVTIKNRIRIINIEEKLWLNLFVNFMSNSCRLPCIISIFFDPIWLLNFAKTLHWPVGRYSNV